MSAAGASVVVRQATVAQPLAHSAGVGVEACLACLAARLVLSAALSWQEREAMEITRNVRHTLRARPAGCVVDCSLAQVCGRLLSRRVLAM